MKKIILLVLPFFFLVLGCEEPISDYTPINQVFECTFTKVKPEKYLKISLECLEHKENSSRFSFSSTVKNYAPKEGVILVPKKELTGNGNKCYINIAPYPKEFSDLEATKERLTYILSIYKDEELLWEKKLEFPKKKYETIKIDL